jgi:cytochrome b561
MQRYTKIAMLLHWLVALLIIATFFLGLTMVDIPASRRPSSNTSPGTNGWA